MSSKHSVIVVTIGTLLTIVTSITILASLIIVTRITIPTSITIVTTITIDGYYMQNPHGSFVPRGLVEDQSSL